MGTSKVIGAGFGTNVDGDVAITGDLDVTGQISITQTLADSGSDRSLAAVTTVTPTGNTAQEYSGSTMEIADTNTAFNFTNSTTAGFIGAKTSITTNGSGTYTLLKGQTTTITTSGAGNHTSILGNQVRLVGGSSGTISNLFGYNITPDIDTGQTATTLIGYNCTNNDGSGSITNTFALGLDTEFINNGSMKVLANSADVQVPYSNSSTRFLVDASDAVVPNLKPGTYNLHIAAATTTNANDSIKITASNGSALSATNYGYVVIESDTNGELYVEKITADVTIDLTGAHWGAGGGSFTLTDAILRVLALNDGGSIKWGVAYQGGRQIILDTLDSATATDINLPEEVLVNSALTVDAQALEAFWFKADFTDTGGAAEDLWAVQSGDGDLNTGSADGQWQPYNPTFSGFSATDAGHRWMSVGNTVYVTGIAASGTGSSTTVFTTTVPTKIKGDGNGMVLGGGVAFDSNGTWQTGGGLLYSASTATQTIGFSKDGNATGGWVASGSRQYRISTYYEQN
jgi:hypothetical protein